MFPKPGYASELSRDFVKWLHPHSFWLSRFREACWNIKNGPRRTIPQYTMRWYIEGGISVGFSKPIGGSSHSHSNSAQWRTASCGMSHLHGVSLYLLIHLLYFWNHCHSISQFKWGIMSSSKSKNNPLLWTKCLCPSKIDMLKPYLPMWWHLGVGVLEGN